MCNIRSEILEISKNSFKISLFKKSLTYNEHFILAADRMMLLSQNLKVCENKWRASFNRINIIG